MATPTPPSASKRTAGGVSTPSHLNHSSPAPRSVPSPVAARYSAGKTPINHPTSSSSQGSKTIGSTPMVQNLSQTGNTSSPSANMLSFSTPNALGLESATPAGLNIPTPVLGGANMMPSMSELGLTTSGAKRNEDEERRAKMRRVLKSIGKPKGRVSEEGIARIARRVGFQNDIDAEKLTPEEKERKVGNRPIMTAGNAVVVEVDLKNQTPQNVQVSYGQKKSSMELGELAGKMFLEDLSASRGVPLDAKLDRFARNLENLARLDRLSAGGVNCFEALGGVYMGLKKLYDVELAGVLERTKASVSRADTEVMCKASGKPRAHSRGEFGFELDYWRDGRHINARPAQDDTATDLGEAVPPDDSPEEDNDNLHILRLEVEPSSPVVYPSLRISESWIDGSFDPATAEIAKVIPWQEPPPTLIISSNGTIGTDTMVVDGGAQKLPDLRFIARLDPPIVMPYQIAMNVLTSVGLPTPTMLRMPPQFAALLLDPQVAFQAQQPNAAYSTTAEHAVLSSRQGRETSVQHSYVLNSAKPDWGFKFDELPFSHPRQLVELLPTLRQWACIGSLLKNTFRRGTAPQDQQKVTNGNEHAGVSTTWNNAASTLPQHPNSNNFIHTNGKSTLENLLTPRATPPHDDDAKIQVNIALTTSPIPTLGFTFPTSSQEGRIGNVNVQILSNADLVFTSHRNIFDSDGDAANDAEEGSKRLAKALDVCGDVGVWVEWMRRIQSS